MFEHVTTYAGDPILGLMINMPKTHALTLKSILVWRVLYRKMVNCLYVERQKPPNPKS